jgi:DNA helicase II / ATP-dependent DNA helicase PcrA
MRNKTKREPFLTSPRLRGEVDAKRRVRGHLSESELGETPPHPNPLPASGAREQN